MTKINSLKEFEAMYSNKFSKQQCYWFWRSIDELFDVYIDKDEIRFKVKQDEAAI